jgi:hypothetical protein
MSSGEAMTTGFASAKAGADAIPETLKASTVVQARRRSQPDVVVLSMVLVPLSV